jgi:hypothetical protein
MEYRIRRFHKKIKGIPYEEKINNDFHYQGYYIKSKLFGLDEQFGITYNFVNNIMTSVSLNRIKYLKENYIVNRKNFEETQKWLEEILGKNKSKNLVGDKYIWKFGKIKIIHSLYETFGMQESLIIEP